MRTVLALTILLVAVPLAEALPTPGFNGAASDAVLGRIFPEALMTNDYVSYAEAIAGLKTLAAEAPDRVTYIPIGPSTGWTNPTTGEREPTEMFAVEVTDATSPVNASDKLTLVFYLSIHGNEKGGREGGLRVIEDLARGIGLAEEEPELLEYLKFQKLAFIFANTDGWTHEELEYRASDEATPFQYTRENAHFLDLNRQFPTVGYLFEEYTPLSESESRNILAYTNNLTNIVAGADMHGMLQNTNLVRMLLKDGEKSQQELFENQRLAELYKERLNGNPAYDSWASAPDVTGVCCGQVAEWAATFDAIGYSASGTAGAWIVQDQGLDAPGFTVEYAYNHLVADNYYPGAGAQFNEWHVEATRDIVSVFMNFAAEKVNLAVETHGVRIAVLTTPFVATNADDDASAYAGWAAENPHDDLYDIMNNAFTSTPNAYWDDLKGFVKDGDLPGVLDAYDSPRALVASLDTHDAVVVSGSAVSRILADASSAQALRAWVERGGNLVLTDGALQLLEPLGLAAKGDVDMKLAYSGYTDLVDRAHPLAENLKGFPRQTYDPNPLGFAPGSSPVWFVDRAVWEGAGGVTVGAVGKAGTGEAVVEDPADCNAATPTVPLRLRRPDHDHAGEASVVPHRLQVPVHVTAPVKAFAPGVDCQELDAVNVGVLKLGEGRIHVFGAILPDATEESNHPYGLDNYAVAANGNLLLLNMLGAEYVYTTPPAVEALGFARILAGDAATTAAADGASDATARVPAPGPALVAVALLSAAVALRRR
jgi:hypothetical protein